MSTTKTHITRIGTVLVPVGDQDGALRFFTETLGFETRIDGEFGEGERWIEVAPPGTETTIARVDSQASEVSFATDNADAAHEELRLVASTPTPEALRPGEGCRRCSPSGIRTGTATDSSSETENRRGHAAALRRGGLPAVRSGHRTVAAYAASRSASSRGRLSVT